MCQGKQEYTLHEGEQVKDTRSLFEGTGRKAVGTCTDGDGRESGHSHKTAALWVPPPPPPPGSRGGGAEGMLLRTPPDRQHLHLRLRGQTASLSR